MYAVEFESVVGGNMLEIPAHFLKQIGKNRHVKVIMLMPERTVVTSPSLQANLKTRLLAIAKHCANLPLLDTRKPDDILGYDEYGIPSP